MKKNTIALSVIVGAGIALVSTPSPAGAEITARVAYSTPTANTVVATISSFEDVDMTCFVSFYGERSYMSERYTFEPATTATLRVTGLPPGRYSAYLKCMALQVDKSWVRVWGPSVNSPASHWTGP